MGFPQFLFFQQAGSCYQYFIFLDIGPSHKKKRQSIAAKRRVQALPGVEHSNQDQLRQMLAIRSSQREITEQWHLSPKTGIQFPASLALRFLPEETSTLPSPQASVKTVQLDKALMVSFLHNAP